MMAYAHLAQRLYNAALLLDPAKAEVIEAVFRSYTTEGRQLEVAADQIDAAKAAEARHEMAVAGMKRSENGYLMTPRGVAVIPVIGTLLQRSGGMDAMSGMEGYNRIGAKLDAALIDPNVRGILLEIDSPGGEANGAFDLAARIAAAGESKPVWAIANEQAFSAAYLIASAAQRLVVPASGMVGSVGVIMMHVDQSVADAKKGYAYTPIYAGARKADFSSHAPLSDLARGLAQGEVDRVYEMFVHAVAEGRGIDPQAVRDTEAGLLSPADALSIGMIDGVQAFGESILEFEAAASKPRTMFHLTAAAAASTEREVMSEAKGPAASETAAKYTQQELADAEAKGRVAARAEATKEGATAAKARIAAILNHPEAEGRTEQARHLAFETDIPAEQAVDLMKHSAKVEAAKPADPKNALAAAMATVPNPKVGAAADPSAEGPRMRTSAEIFAMRRKQAGHA